MAAQAAEEVIKSEWVDLDILSVAEDSSWRELDEDHIENLICQIEEGKWGRTNVARPSVRMLTKDDVMLSTIDGKQRLRNGKHIVVAVTRVRTKHLEWHAAQPAGKPENPWDHNLPWLPLGNFIGIVKMP